MPGISSQRTAQGLATYEELDEQQHATASNYTLTYSSCCKVRACSRSPKVPRQRWPRYSQRQRRQSRPLPRERASARAESHNVETSIAADESLSFPNLYSPRLSPVVHNEVAR